MISTTDIANIIYSECRRFPYAVYQDGSIPFGRLEEDGRVTIHVKSLSESRYWMKCYVEVNFFVPDIKDNMANLIELNLRERLAKETLKGSGEYDGTPFSYRVDSTQMLNASELNAHYINAKILFKVLNVI